MIPFATAAGKYAVDGARLSRHQNDEHRFQSLFGVGGRHFGLAMFPSLFQVRLKAAARSQALSYADTPRTGL